MLHVQCHVQCHVHATCCWNDRIYLIIEGGVLILEVVIHPVVVFTFLHRHFRHIHTSHLFSIPAFHQSPSITPAGRSIGRLAANACMSFPTVCLSPRPIPWPETRTHHTLTNVPVVFIHQVYMNFPFRTCSFQPWYKTWTPASTNFASLSFTR
jgi:hypothetical protein